MVERFHTRTWRELEPRIGWLTFGLLITALAIVLAAALQVQWILEDEVIVPMAFIGFGLALWLSQQRIPAWAAWLLLITVGMALAIAILAQLWPPLNVFRQGRAATAGYWEQALALWGDRLGGWARSVTGGGRSTETMGFALGLALAAWFLGAFLAWSTGRLDKAYWGLAALGAALALTTYFGGAGLYWVIAFVGVAITTIAITQYSRLERRWERTGTDYSGEVRLELLTYAGAVSLLLMSVAYALPAINVRAIAQSFRRQPAVSEAEETLSRVFAGVAQPRQIEEVSAGGTSGVLPRSFLLTSAPDLLESVVLTATLSIDGRPVAPPPGYHWRATSYDVYTGRGWLRSREREEAFAAEGQLPVPADELHTTAPVIELTQDVELAEETRTTRYTIGRLLSVDRPSVAYWRGVDDLVRVRDAAPRIQAYHAVSRAVLPSPEDLRAARLEDVPPTILARYTELPGTVPERVAQLAREVVGLNGTATESPLSAPYDQALALESFLHQFPYSLDVGPPPPNGDMADYFLFDLQTGFCDYYATAMVVMARSVGLPARLAIGFLPQAADEDGRQTMTHLDSHSWAEIYFAGYGWVEFEPTAPIPGQEASMIAVASPDHGPVLPPSTVAHVTIPDRAPANEPPRSLIVAIALATLAILGLWGWRRQMHRQMRPRNLDGVQQVYYDLQQQSQRLGYLPRSTQTPSEFVSGLASQVQTLAGDQTVIPMLNAQLCRLAELYGRRQYGREQAALGPEAGAEAAALWKSIQPRLSALASRWPALRRIGGS